MCDDTFKTQHSTDVDVDVYICIASFNGGILLKKSCSSFDEIYFFKLGNYIANRRGSKGVGWGGLGGGGASVLIPTI